jgi:hypothetical protein
MGQVIEAKKVEEILGYAEKGRTALAKALLEDENVRHNNEQRAREHIEEIEAQKNEMPNWMWNLLFYALGMLTAMSEPALFNLIWNWLKAHGGG